METKQGSMEASTLTAEDRKALEKMHAELKRSLKTHSKNDLIRMLSSALVDLHFMRKAFIDLQELVERAVPKKDEQ